MKNLKNKKNLELLPTKEPVAFRDKWWMVGNGSDYHPVDGVWPHKRIKRLINDNIGKSFDQAFSKYCSQVPKYQQKYFLKEFENDITYRGLRWDHYYIDDNGLIQIKKAKRNKKAIYFHSDDYKTAKLHKVTLAPYPSDFWDKRLKYINEKDYAYFIIEGYEIEFSSKKDPLYKRLTVDQRKRKKSIYRQYLQQKNEKLNELIKRDYQFQKQEELKEKEKDRLKIEANGFDYYTSFRSEKQIHPDLITDKKIKKSN